MFLDPDHADDQNMSLLLETSGVGNVRLDSPFVRSVFRCDFPSSMFDIIQEAGRAKRVPNANPLLHSYYLSCSLEGFMHPCERTVDPNSEFVDE